MFLLLQHGEHVGTVCGENESRSIRQSLFHAVPATTTRSPRARELKKQAPLNLPNDDRSRPNDVERVRTRPNRARKPPAFREKINSQPRVERVVRAGRRSHAHSSPFVFRTPTKPRLGSCVRRRRCTKTCRSPRRWARTESVRSVPAVLHFLSLYSSIHPPSNHLGPSSPSPTVVGGVRRFRTSFPARARVRTRRTSATSRTRYAIVASVVVRRRPSPSPTSPARASSCGASIHPSIHSSSLKVERGFVRVYIFVINVILCIF